MLLRRTAIDAAADEMDRRVWIALMNKLKDSRRVFTAAGVQRMLRQR